MCGFVVALGNNLVSNEVILKMTRVINHRGPDNSGYIRFDHKNGNIKQEDNINNISNDYSLVSAAGFKRLSIRDKSENGNQPMVSQKNNSFICFNGEIYNTDFLKNRLSKKSYDLRSTSDTEIILEYFLEFGIEDLSKSIEGMYAIFLYDSKNKEIYLIRDRFGVKPLYYSQFNGNLVIASEIKSLKEHPEFKFSVNYDCFDEFLKFRYVTAPFTLINGVNQVKPGEVIRIDKDLRISEAFNIWENNIDCNLNQKAISLKNILKESISKQLVSDVEVGLQLSGGIDSSLITYFTDKITPKKYNLKTFSIIFDDLKYSEENWISLATKNTYTSNFLKEINSQEFINSIENVSYHLDHPINHPNTIGIYFLANLTKKKGIKVVLSGEGADELFGGYARFIYIYMRNNKYLKFIFQKIKFIENILNKKLNTTSINIEDQIIQSTSKNSDMNLKRIFRNYSKIKALRNRRNIFKNIKDKNVFTKQKKYEILTYLQSLLIRQDKMNMAFGVENRVPFLSIDCLKASLSERYNKLNFKYIVKALFFILKNPKCFVDTFTKISLKKESLNIFGSKFTFRKKSGFAFPIDEYMRSKEFVSLVENKLFFTLEETPLSRNLIKNYWRNFLDNNDDRNVELLWTIFTFLIWIDVFQK